MPLTVGVALKTFSSFMTLNQSVARLLAAEIVPMLATLRTPGLNVPVKNVGPLTW